MRMDQRVPMNARRPTLIRFAVGAWSLGSNRCMKPIPTRPAAVRDLAHEAAARCGGAGARSPGLAVEWPDCGAVRGTAGVLGCEPGAVGCRWPSGSEEIRRVLVPVED